MLNLRGVSSVREIPRSDKSREFNMDVLLEHFLLLAQLSFLSSY